MSDSSFEGIAILCVHDGCEYETCSDIDSLSVCEIPSESERNEYNGTGTDTVQIEYLLNIMMSGRYAFISISLIYHLLGCHFHFSNLFPFIAAELSGVHIIHTFIRFHMRAFLRALVQQQQQQCHI